MRKASQHGSKGNLNIKRSGGGEYGSPVEFPVKEAQARLASELLNRGERQSLRADDTPGSPRSFSRVGSMASLSIVGDVRASPMGSMILIAATNETVKFRQKISEVKRDTDRKLQDFVHELESMKSELDGYRDIKELTRCANSILDIGEDNIDLEKERIKREVRALQTLRSSPGADAIAKQLICQLIMVLAKLSRAVDTLNSSGSFKSLKEDHNIKSSPQTLKAKSEFWNHLDSRILGVYLLEFLPLITNMPHGGEATERAADSRWDRSLWEYVRYRFQGSNVEKKEYCRICEQCFALDDFAPHAKRCEKLSLLLAELIESIKSLAKLHGTWTEKGRETGSVGVDKLGRESKNVHEFCQIISEFLQHKKRRDSYFAAPNTARRIEKLFCSLSESADASRPLLNAVKYAKRFITRVLETNRALRDAVQVGGPELGQELLALKQTSTFARSFGRNERVQASDFIVIDEISRGAFGIVLKCQKIGTGDTFAVKVIPKQSLQQRNMATKAKAERDIMAAAMDSSVVRLYWAAEAEAEIFLVMEHIRGGDLCSILQDLGFLTEKQAKFYIAELILALEYLHKSGIIHRDIKPANVLVDDMGHIRLTDFGLSSVTFADPSTLSSSTCNCVRKSCKKGHPKLVELYEYSEGSNGSARSAQKDAVGTPDYLAPEVLLGLGHTPTADFWSLGICVFEFLTGVPPFHDNNTEAIFQRIVSNEIAWPEDGGMSAEARSFIESLLSQEPSSRLGAKGIDELKNHPFMEGIDWDEVRTSEPSFQPTLDLMNDIQHEEMNLATYFSMRAKTSKFIDMNPVMKDFYFSSLANLISLNKKKLSEIEMQKVSTTTGAA